MFGTFLKSQVSDRLPTTLDLVDVHGVTVPVQTGCVVPSFEIHRPRIDLAGAWRGRRVDAPAAPFLAMRSDAVLARLRDEGGVDRGAEGPGWGVRNLPAPENRMPEVEHDANPEHFEGVVWYVRAFDAPAEAAAGPSRLVFHAVNYVADVWLNGRYLGWHEGGYTPFAFLLEPGCLRDVGNDLRVRVGNPAWGSDPTTVPAVVTDWCNYAGILQDVYVEALPAARIDRLDVVPAVEALEPVAVIAGALDGDSVRFLLCDADWRSEDGVDATAESMAGQPVAAATVPVLCGSDGIAVARTRLVLAEPRRWTPGTPNLYVVRAELHRGGQSVDRVAVQTGFRSIGVKDGAPCLNGRPVLLCGLARHEDWPDTGRTATPARILRDLQVIRGLGADFLRTSHYPNHPATYVLADRLGLMTAEEIPVWQHKPKHFAADARAGVTLQMWREMIFRDRNRPSLIAWSGGNECAGENPPKARAAYLNGLRDDLRARYDDGRLVMQSAAADETGPEDASQDGLDLAGWTMYFGIFHGGTCRDGTLKFLRRAGARFPGKPIVATEFGFWTSPATEDPFWILRDPRKKDWRHVHGKWEGRQVEVLRETVAAFEAFLRQGGSLGGVVWWSVFDWYRHVPGVQTMGLVRMDRVGEKPAAAEMRAAFVRLRAAFEDGRAR